jgi:hypothetical protein
MARMLMAVALVASLGVGTIACGGTSDPKVQATLGEYTIKLSKYSLGAGKVKIEAKNTGGATHELVLVREPNAASLPTKPDGTVDEDKIPDNAKMGEIEDIGAGTSKSKTFDLAAGRYVAFCNVVTSGVSHYAKGMRTQFAVTG